MKFCIVVTEVKSAMTGALKEGAVKSLRDAWCLERNIVIKSTP